MNRFQAKEDERGENNKYNEDDEEVKLELNEADIGRSGCVGGKSGNVGGSNNTNHNTAPQIEEKANTSGTGLMQQGNLFEYFAFIYYLLLLTIVQWKKMREERLFQRVVLMTARGVLELLILISLCKRTSMSFFTTSTIY